MTKKIKCSKCNKSITTFNEYWKNGFITFYLNNGEWESCHDFSDGDPYCVYAECECGHKWKLRGITQIYEVIGGNDENNM